MDPQPQEASASAAGEDDEPGAVQGEEPGEGEPAAALGTEAEASGSADTACEAGCQVQEGAADGGCQAEEGAATAADDGRQGQEGAAPAADEGCQAQEGAATAADEGASAESGPAPPMSWAQRASKGMGSASSKAPPPAASAAVAPAADPAPKPPDGFVEYLAWLLSQKQAAEEGDSTAPCRELPECFRRFEGLALSGVSNIARVTHSRLGLRNDANTCYVNVVIQSLLPCSALMWFLRRCTEGDPQRPFVSCLVSICKEFHTRKQDTHGDIFSVLSIPQVETIISSWQKFGAQQDAGEFLFYILNGMHEETKWDVASHSLELPADAEKSTDDSGPGGWAHLVKTSRRQVEARAAGLHEDSPIMRIFGGLMQSAVRSKSAKADSVSLEPFNHLCLDISQPAVKCVKTALDAFFSAEVVSDGQATRRLQFKALPKVLILSLKRFTFNQAKGGAQRVKKTIKYDQRLAFERGWFVDDRPPPEYCISALICHYGETVNGGHYTAIVRYNEEWYLYDDTSVRRLEGREVAAQQYHVYLLVYMARSTVDMTP